MTRLMRSSQFRREQESRLHEPHIAPITQYIDSLRTPEKWLPYVAPLHGGVESRMMTLLRDPGPGTRVGTGSGMLCTENDDQTAANQCELMSLAGLVPSDFTPWNAYPWYINRAPSKAQLREASAALVGMLNLMPQVRVVLLTGKDAQSAWDIAVMTQPTLRSKDLTVLRTFHASAQALQTKDPKERIARVQHRIDTWKQAGEIVRAAR